MKVGESIENNMKEEHPYKCDQCDTKITVLTCRVFLGLCKNCFEEKL